MSCLWRRSICFGVTSSQAHCRAFHAAVDEDDLAFPDAPSACESLGLAWHLLYIRLEDVVLERNRPSSLTCPYFFVLWRTNCPFDAPHWIWILHKVRRTTTCGLWDLTRPQRLRRVGLSGLTCHICSITSRWLLLRPLLSISFPLPTKFLLMLGFVALGLLQLTLTGCLVLCPICALGLLARMISLVLFFVQLLSWSCE